MLKRMGAENLRRILENLDTLLDGYITSEGDASGTTVSFTVASDRTEIATGEELTVLLGKIAKWLSDLKAVAFSGDFADLTNALKLDATLANSGEAADAAATGTAIETLSTRVSNLLSELEANPEYAATAEVVDIRTGYDGTQHETAGDAVRAIGTDLLALKASLQDYIDKSAVDGLYYDETESKLWLTSNGETVGDPVTIVSGTGTGSGATSVVKLLNEGESAFNVAESTDVWLQFNFTSTEDGAATGSGTCKIVVNGATKASFNIQQGSNTVNVKEYISAGENTVRVTCTDIYGVSKSLNYTVNVIVLSISSNFDDTQVYTGDITLKFTPVGILSKTIHFDVDGEELDTMVVEASGKQNTKVIPAMSHGAHPLVVYATADLDGTTLTSNRLVYDVMCAETDNTTVIVAMPYEGGSVTEGDLIEIPFSVYDPANQTAGVVMTISSGGTTYSTQELTVDRTRQTWSTRQYPVGEVTFTIASGSVSKSATVQVAELEIDVEAETEDLELHLTSAGRSNTENNRDVWENNGITTAFSDVNWVDTGWVADDNGDTTLRLSGDARAVIGFTPFSADARAAGKTIELDYLVRDVNNRDAVVISCMCGSIGIQATADRAFIASEQSKAECYYRDEERVRVSFVVEPRTDYRLLSIYLNGIRSGAVQYPDNDNFQQTTPAYISLGSDLCTLDFYAIRSYSTALTDDQIRDNYIADTLDINQRISLYNANDIYDAYGRLTFNELVKRIPTMVITGKLPTVKGDKQTVSVSYTDPFNPNYNFEDTATIDVQGTSSQWYVRKNWKIKTSVEHQHADGQLPAKVWCMKADYAEATGTHNTGNANYAHTLYDVKTPPQEVDERVRTTIFGFPSVIFHKADEFSEPEFIGKYNFNYDKGAENVFGFSEEYPFAECWEFCNNTSDACLFHGEIPASFGDDFEARYPDGYKTITAFKKMHDWVVSTWQDGATGAELGSTYTDVDGGTHTADTAAYRLAKFKTEFENYFDKQFTLIYYIYTLTMLMVDQRAKNMFLTTWDGVHWEPWLYDNDTCLGINNEGALVFDYYHEDIDKVGGANVYNGQDSTLWVNFREAFASEIEETYKTLRSSGKLSFEKIYEYFITNQSDKWSISVYNEDADYKYISMLRSDNDASNLNQIRGSGKEHLGYFVDNRLKYLDSKFNAAEYADNYASLRIYTPSTWEGVEPNANITVTPFSDMYAGVKYKANGTLQQTRATKNVPVTFNAPDETFNDTETAIFGASEISSLGDLSPLYCGSVNVANATKLTEIIVGSATEGYSNTYLKEMVVGTNKLLRKIDVRNCPALTAPLALTGCPNLEEIYATGTSITGVELPNSGYLKKLYLPGTITNLTVLNQEYIEEYECGGYDNLTTLRIENSPAVPMDEIIMNAPNLNRIRVIGVDLQLTDTTILELLASCGGLTEAGVNTDKPVVVGRAYIPSIAESDLERFSELLPNLTITYDAYLPEHIVTFKNWDGTVLDVQYVVSGKDAVEPIAAGRIETPTKEGDAQYSYTFASWYGAYTNVTSDRIITATYTQSINQYTVRFYNDTKVLQTSTVNYGGAVTYTGSTPVYSGTEIAVFVFEGWSADTSCVVEDMDVYAVFTEVELEFVVPETVTSFQDCTWAQIKAVADAGHVNDDGDWCIDDEVWWSVGDTKSIATRDGYNLILALYDFSHDDKPDGTKAPLTIGFARNISEKDGIYNTAPGVWNTKMNSTGTNTGGWEASLARSNLNDTYFNKLPDELRVVITEVYKSSMYGGSDSTKKYNIVTTADKLFFLSLCELGLKTSSKGYMDEGEQYPIFTDNDSRVVKYYSIYGVSGRTHWTRSPVSTSSSSFYQCANSGSASDVQGHATNTSGVVFAFCI